MTFSRAVLIIFIVSAIFLMIQPAEAVKPMAPLEMTLELEGVPTVGGEVPVLLKIRSFIEVPLVKIQLTLPNDLEIASGQDTWEWEFTAGSLKEMRFILKVKRSGRHTVRAMAMIQHPDGFKMAKRTSLLIDLEPELSLGIESRQEDKEEKKSRTIKGKDGQDFRIFSFEKTHK